MSVVNCCTISVTSLARPISNDSNASSSTPQPPLSPPTKIILPRKKPLKWSTGVASGEYGGPPTTTKLRKYWGGEEEDPLTSDDFIWNKEFMGRMKRLIEDADDSADSRLSSVKEEPSGFLNLSRAMNLDSLEVDLSKELMASAKSVIEEPVEATQNNIQSGGGISRRRRLVPTRREQEKWDRAAKAATGGTEVRRPQGDPKVLIAQSREQYFKLKKKLQIFTLAIGGVGLVSAYVSYSPEVAASYGAGLAGSLVYVRMLGSSVDSLADGAKGLIKGAVAQPRLLVPVILVMIYNWWNGCGKVRCYIRAAQAPTLPFTSSNKKENTASTSGFLFQTKGARFKLRVHLDVLDVYY